MNRLMSKSIFKVRYIYILCVLLGAISIFLRYPAHNEYIYTNSDATEHVLLTMESLRENSIQEHKFGAIMTLGSEDNKYINNGPSLLTDESGNNFYISFSAISFLVPYIAFKVLNINISESNLFIFNSVLFIMSFLLLITVLLKVFGNLSDMRSFKSDEKGVGGGLCNIMLGVRLSFLSRGNALSRNCILGSKLIPSFLFSTDIIIF